jgi:hypothetical protein
MVHVTAKCTYDLITKQTPTSPVGYQIVGPYPCQQSFFENCAAQSSDPAEPAIAASGRRELFCVLSRRERTKVRGLHMASSPAVGGGDES